MECLLCLLLQIKGEGILYGILAYRFTGIARYLSTTPNLILQREVELASLIYIFKIIWKLIVIDSTSYGSVVPQLAFSLQVTGMAIGYGTTTPPIVPPQILESFPLSSINCHAYGHLSDGTRAINQFNALTPPENPYIILINSISYSSTISISS